MGSTFKKTATEITIEHYSRPEVKEIICKYALLSNGSWRALNGDFQRWYRYDNNDNARLLNVNEDYDYVIGKDRTVYCTLNVFDTSLKSVWMLKDGITSDNPLGTPADTLAYTLGVDIDKGPECNIDNAEIKEAIESAAQYLVDDLKRNGIIKSIWALFSGGGIYVHIHHEICKPNANNDRAEFFELLTDSFNRYIAHISDEFFKAHAEHKGKVKFDALNNSKRVFKCILSVHKSKPYAVTPLNRANIKIDLARAQVPLKDDMLAEAREWYSSYDPTEKDALFQLLDKFRPSEEELKHKQNHFVEIWRSPSKIEIDKFAPCIRFIIDTENTGEGKTRYSGVLATFLYQLGWNEDEAWELVEKVSDRNGLSNVSHIFESCYGSINCPSCRTIQTDAVGYPHLGLKGLWKCPDECLRLGCMWPGNYPIQKVLNDSSYAAKKEGIQKVLSDLAEKLKEDPGVVYESPIWEALRDVHDNDPPEWERVKKTLRSKHVSLNELKASFKEEDEEIILIESPFVALEGGKLAEMVVQDGIAKYAIYDPVTGNITYVPELRLNNNSNTRIIPPASDEIFLKGYVSLPSHAEEYGTETELYNQIRAFVHKYLEVSEDYETIASLYPMLSWVYDVMSVIVYLRARGDWGTGKSRFLTVFCAICYRAVSATGAISEAPIFRVMDKWHGTLVIDEADFNTKTDASATISKILNCGYEQHKPVLRCDANDPENVNAFDPFGPKIIATRFDFKDKALESRCFTEIMKERTRKDIPIELPPAFHEEALHLRNKLLMYRFRNRDKKRKLSESGGNIGIGIGTGIRIDFSVLPDRMQQAARPMSIVVGDHPELQKMLKKFLEDKALALVLEASETTEGHIIKILASDDAKPKPDPKNNLLKWDLTISNIFERIKTEDEKLKPGQVRARANSLGLKTVKDYLGDKRQRIITCDKDLFERLKRRYIPDEPESEPEQWPDCIFWKLGVIWDGLGLGVVWDWDDLDDLDNDGGGGGHTRDTQPQSIPEDGDGSRINSSDMDGRGVKPFLIYDREDKCSAQGGVPPRDRPECPERPKTGPFGSGPTKLSGSIRVKFNTEYGSDIPDPDDPLKFISRTFAEGEIVELPAERAQKYISRGIAQKVKMNA